MGKTRLAAIYAMAGFTTLGVLALSWMIPGSANALATNLAYLLSGISALWLFVAALTFYKQERVLFRRVNTERFKLLKERVQEGWGAMHPLALQISTLETIGAVIDNRFIEAALKREDSEAVLHLYARAGDWVTPADANGTPKPTSPKAYAFYKKVRPVLAWLQMPPEAAYALLEAPRNTAHGRSA